MALGLNIVVGFAGLLDLGYVAFYALGAYSRRLVRLELLLQGQRPRRRHRPPATKLPGIHLNFVLILIAAVGHLRDRRHVIGLPTLRLRGDYIAIVTLAFGEIIGVVAVNGDSVHVGGGMTLTAGNLGHQRRRPAVLPGRRARSTCSTCRPWYWLIFVHPADRAVRQPAAARLAPRPGLGGAARGRGRRRLDGHPARCKTKLLAYAIGRRLRRDVGRVPRRLLHQVNADQFQFGVLDLRPRDGHHRRPRLDLGRGARRRCCCRYINYYLIPDVLNGAARRSSGSNFYADRPEFGIFGFLLVLVMVLRPQGLIPERRRKLELDRAEIARRTRARRSAERHERRPRRPAAAARGPDRAAASRCDRASR